MDLVDSDSDAPFTLKTNKGKEIKKHEIVIKHERNTESPSTTNMSPLTTAFDTLTPFESELKTMDRKIEALDDILKMYDVEDTDYKKYKDKKRDLLVAKYEFLEAYSSEPSLFTPLKK